MNPIVQTVLWLSDVVVLHVGDWPEVPARSGLLLGLVCPP